MLKQDSFFSAHSGKNDHQNDLGHISLNPGGHWVFYLSFIVTRLQLVIIPDEGESTVFYVLCKRYVIFKYRLQTLLTFRSDGSESLVCGDSPQERQKLGGFKEEKQMQGRKLLLQTGARESPLTAPARWDTTSNRIDQ